MLLGKKEINVLTIMYPIYNVTSENMDEHLQNWSNYSEDLRKNIEFILVDDGSKEPLDLSPTFKMNLTIARIEQDLGWNIGGAKNLGFYIAKQGWVFTTDVDHFLLPKDCEKMIKLKKTIGNVYFLTRYRDGMLGKRHGNTFIMHRQDFWNLGGFHEDLTGNYGYNDPLLHILIRHYNLKWIATDIKIYEYKKYSYTRNHPEAKNGKSINERKVAIMRQQLKNGTYTNNNVLRFNWKIIKKVSYEKGEIKNDCFSC